MKDLTLNDLFFPSGDDAGEAFGDGGLIDLQGEIQQQLPKLPMKSLEKEMAAKVGEVLNVGIDQVLIAAWKKFQAFRDYADPAKHPPEETVLLPLAKHSIKSSHRPQVDLAIKEMHVASLALEVKLALDLEGVVLKIQGGRILDVGAGSCQVSGRLDCHLKSRVGVKEILKREQKKKFQLRAALKLGDGIVIPPPHGAAAA